MKQARAQTESIRGKLIKFFKQNPNPNDDAIHAFADQLGMSPHDVETQIYALLTWYMSGDFLKHGDDPDSNFDPKELEMGIKVEMEHTNDPAIAKKIAKAHLAEISDYYTWLLKMEKEAKAMLASFKIGQTKTIAAPKAVVELVDHQGKSVLNKSFADATVALQWIVDNVMSTGLVGDAVQGKYKGATVTIKATQGSPVPAKTLSAALKNFIRSVNKPNKPAPSAPQPKRHDLTNLQGIKDALDDLLDESKGLDGGFRHEKIANFLSNLRNRGANASDVYKAYDYLATKFSKDYVKRIIERAQEMERALR
jgi:hypothetical protein